MKDALFCISAMFLFALVLFLNHKVPGAKLWKGTRLEPQFSDRFPLFPTSDLQREKKHPALWFWSLVELLVIVLILIWFLKSLGK